MSEVSDDPRKTRLAKWFTTQYDHLPGRASWHSEIELESISSDASFRRYFRVSEPPPGRSVVLMDAPPEKEDTDRFLAIAKALHHTGVLAPHIYAADAGQGFVCLEDFGNVLLLARLKTAAGDLDDTEATELYQMAFIELLKMQQATEEVTQSLPLYDEALLRQEMSLFTDWLCERFLGLQDMPDLSALHDTLVASALAQPQVFVHRDYHSRNLMYRGSHGLGVLDFQDAVLGPVTYDLVSLLKDCYIAWPQDQVRRWALRYKAQAERVHLLSGVSNDDFLRYFDLMGLQRHMKAAGIFARLYLRDGKPAYLGDIPRTLSYILALGSDYEEVPGLLALQTWLRERAMPALAQALPEAGARA